jgi:hypothetical protein
MLLQAGTGLSFWTMAQQITIGDVMIVQLALTLRLIRPWA